MDPLLNIKISRSTVQEVLDRLGAVQDFDPEFDLRPSQLELFAEFQRALVDDDRATHGNTAPPRDDYHRGSF